MEQNFKKLLQLSKANNPSLNPLMKTFEGALFQDSAWFFDSETDPIAVLGRGAVEIVAEAVTEAVTKTVSKSTASSDLLCEVVFLGDSHKGEGEDLLGRMITAMKLSGDEFFRYHLNEELENITDLAGNLENPDQATCELFKFIEAKRPKVVVSLGATITNILLGKREKLSGIHGQFFEKTIGECTFSLMPVFHPEFLLINPNMKRTAWIDLQKVMERIGKI
jgi:DNA polymerase